VISIIVSSVRDQLFDAFVESVRQTIGVTHEVIRIENKNGEIGICESYNRGASRSNYPLLCFIHEDVIFHTPGWGNILMDYFNDDPEIGLIGIAGSKIKTRMISNWWQPVIRGHEPKRGKVLQHFANKPAQVTEWWEGDALLEEVVTIDGVFLAVRRPVWEQNKFDAGLLTRFHAYDFDFSMQVGRNWKVCATRAILLEHFSLGSYNLEWIRSTLDAHRKWKHYLPKTVHPDIRIADFVFLENQYINECYAKLAVLKVSLDDSLHILFSAISLLYPSTSLLGFYWRIKMTASWIKGYFTRK
jgi:hypothetical protein